MKLCNSKQEIDELKEEQQYCLVSLFPLEILTRQQSNFTWQIISSQITTCLRLCSSAGLLRFKLVPPATVFFYTEGFSHQVLRMPCGGFRRPSLSLAHAFVCLWLYVTVFLLYKVAVLVIRVSFYLISFEMDVKLYGHTQTAAPCKQAKSKILKMEDKEKLASRQLNSPFCTAYGPPGGFGQ